MILHIPHSSLKIPSVATQSFIVSKDEIKELKVFFADLYTDWLYSGEKKVKAKYNRIVLDVERFTDPEKEPMSKLGMGLVYTNSYDKRKFSLPTKEHLKFALEEYRRHHAKLDRAVEKELEKRGKCLILDCHSFGEKMVNSIFGYSQFPDICIGFDEEFVPHEILELAKKYFENCGYSVALNYPYSGSLVPNSAYNRKDTRVKSIMLEINKKIYMTGDKRNKHARTLKRQIRAFIKEANKLFYGANNKR